MQNNKTDEMDFNLSSEQINRMEEIFKQKQMNYQKKTVDKRSSTKFKSINRQSTIVNKVEMTAIDIFGAHLENVDKNLELIEEFLQKRRIHYLCELKNKTTLEQYKSFLSCLQVLKLIQGAKVQQQGKYHNYHYIIIEGSMAAYRQKKAKDEQKEYIEAFQFEVGEAILSNTLQTHKYNPYTIKAKKASTLLKFNQENFTKYIKRIYQKEIDELSAFLCHTLPFRGIAANEMKKYIPFCSFKRFAYSQLVYSEGDLIRQLFLILHGEVEISYETDDSWKVKDNKRGVTHSISANLYKVNHQINDKKEVKIVRVGKRQLFGLEAHDVFKENYYTHHVRVTSDSLKVLSIGLDVLYDIQMENPTLEDNLTSYIKKITAIHNNLFEKYQKVTTDAPPKKKKRKRKLKKRSEISLEWWGLAEKIEGSKKYRLPTPPHTQSQKNMVRKQPLLLQNRTSKLDYFKRRLFEEEMEGLQELQQKENDEPTYPQVLIPKLQKVKIKMINPKPKVINNAERIKRKLVEYAKNGEIYCDKLQLE